MIPGHEAVQVQIPGALPYIAVARGAVDSLSERLPLSPDARAAVRLAVGEACNNAVFYAQPTNSTVRVDCRVGPEALEIEVTNRGNAFHPGTPAWMPAAEALTERGRGRALIEMLMDSVEYLSEDGNTIVRMRKTYATAQGCFLKEFPS